MIDTMKKDNFPRTLTSEKIVQKTFTVFLCLYICLYITACSNQATYNETKKESVPAANVHELPEVKLCIVPDRYRVDKPLMKPEPKSAVATKPAHFK